MHRPLLILLACLFVVMIGLGITMPVLPFYVERLALAAGGSRQSVVIQVGLLTGVYALGQLVFAPVWGRLSDRMGRRPLILTGIGGYVIAQVLFGLATSLWLLYAARILGGIVSSAPLPVSAAYVADMTTDVDRGRGMAWLGTAVSLGFVLGPALGGILSRRDLHFTVRFSCFKLDSFSVPFFAAALLGLLTRQPSPIRLDPSIRGARRPRLPRFEVSHRFSFWHSPRNSGLRYLNRLLRCMPKRNLIVVRCKWGPSLWYAAWS